MPQNTGLLELLGQTTKIAKVVFGIATALGTMGINISALVAGLGLTGFALGFAFRDVLSLSRSGNGHLARQGRLKGCFAMLSLAVQH